MVKEVESTIERIESEVVWVSFKHPDPKVSWCEVSLAKTDYFAGADYSDTFTLFVPDAGEKYAPKLGSLKKAKNDERLITPAPTDWNDQKQVDDYRARLALDLGEAPVRGGAER